MAKIRLVCDGCRSNIAIDVESDAQYGICPVCNSKVALRLTINKNLYEVELDADGNIIERPEPEKPAPEPKPVVVEEPVEETTEEEVEEKPDERSFDEIYDHGVELVKDEKFSDAEVEFGKLVERFPEDPKSYIGMFRALTRDFKLSNPNKYYIDHLTETYEKLKGFISEDDEQKYFTEITYVKNILNIGEEEANKPHMRVCPKCGREYVALVKACPNCTTNIGRNKPFSIKSDRLWDRANLSMLCAFLGLLLDGFVIGALPSLLAILLGIKARNKREGNSNVALLGIIVGILGVIFAVFMFYVNIPTLKLLLGK